MTTYFLFNLCISPPFGWELARKKAGGNLDLGRKPGPTNFRQAR